MKKRSVVFHLYMMAMVLMGLDTSLHILPFSPRLLTIPVLITSIFFWYYTTLNLKLNKYLYALNILLLLFSIYGIIPIINNDLVYLDSSIEGFHKVETYSFIIGLYSVLLPIYAIYYFSYKGVCTIKTLVFYFFILLLLYVISYFTNYYFVLNQVSRDGITNNASYQLLPLIPFLYIIKDKIKYQYLILLFFMMLIVFSMKRGAILIALILFVKYVYDDFLNQSRRNKTRFVFLLIMLLCFLGYFVYDLYQSNAWFQYRLESTLEGNTSGRDEMYSDYYNYFINNSSIVDIFLGYGTYSTLKIFDQYAHNDWLEILFGQGVLGIIVYFYYWLFFVISWYEMKDPINKKAIGQLITIYFFASLFSMSIFEMSLCASLLIGYCFAIENSFSKIRNKCIEEKY